MIDAFKFERDWIAAVAVETGYPARTIRNAIRDGRVTHTAESLEPGCVQRIIDRAIARGEEPSKELLHRRLGSLLRRHKLDPASVRIGIEP